MQAVVAIAGQQFRVSEKDEIFVNRLQGEVGANLEFESLMAIDGDKITVGESAKTIKVKAEILEHLKGDKVLVFKKTRRKRYQRLNGHRSYLTKIKISAIA